ncbi:hypothetical protein FGO68_gene809 [Halteria grandinella]|uniref:Uncharacterized protein n=1 Tax=Halteria grandinella TaxID=5974 RepID=A0A8J8T9X5_HALGN|nr:hypothetical protein FGO68_gene809 [Halteria grandinella]
MAQPANKINKKQSTALVEQAPLEEIEISNSEFLRTNVEPTLCQLFTQVLQTKPPDPVPLMVEIFGKMLQEKGLEVKAKSPMDQIQELIVQKAALQKEIEELERNQV